MEFDFLLNPLRAMLEEQLRSEDIDDTCENRLEFWKELKDAHLDWGLDEFGQRIISTMLQYLIDQEQAQIDLVTE